MDRLIQLLRAASLSLEYIGTHSIITLGVENKTAAEQLYQELSDLREHGWLPELSNKLPDTPPDCE